MASKNVIIELIKGKNLDETNYDVWNRKIQYCLNKIEVLETITSAMLISMHNNIIE